MTKILTYDEMIAALQSLQDAAIPALVAGMEIAAAVVEGEAKRNCTLGQSPYEDMVFPTKLAAYQRAGKFKKVRMTTRPSVFVEYEGAYSGAPYSVSDEAVIHMRDTIYSEVDVDQTQVMGVVGTPKDYAVWVHEGTSRMWARPFLTDAIQAKQRAVRQILGEALWDGLYATAGVDQL